MLNLSNLYEREVPVAQLTPIARALQAGLLGLFVTSIACAAESADTQNEPLEATLPVVSVKARADQETATGPVQGYVAKRSSTATKTDTSILETPQSVSVITREELDARGATSVIEAIRYVPGVLAETYGRDDRGFEWFTIRGFENIYSASYLDGLRQPGSGYTSQQNEPYGLERIEVLRGPSSVMYGQGDAGGVVARVSKRPDAAPNNEVRVQIGNFGRRELATDVGGLLSEDGSLMYRLIALGRDNQPQNDYPKYDDKRTKRVYLAPSITWRQSDDTSLTLLSDFLDIRAGTNATEYLGPGQQRSGVLTGEPAFDRHNQRQWSLGYQFEHRLNATWTFRQNMRTASNNVDTRFVWGWGVESADTLGNMTRDAYGHYESMRHTAIDNQLMGRFQLGGIEHTTLLGLDWIRINYKAKATIGAAPGLNVLSPLYGLAVSEPQTAYSDSQDVQRQTGVYIQDQMKLGQHWRLNAGLRHDSVQTRSSDHLTGTSTSVNDSAVTGRLGISYLTSSGWAPYASYTESFLPQTGADFSGKRFDPSRGKQYEVGVKYQPNQGNGLISASLFNLSKTNVQTTDPDHVGYAVQTGEILSRGLEVEVKQEITRGLNVSAQYTLSKTEVTRSNDIDLGKRPVNVPQQMASAWLDYRVQGGDLRGLGFGMGVRHVGKRYADSENLVTIPSHTLMDVAIRYDAKQWSTVLNINNALNKDYVGSFAYGYYPGVRRTVNLSTTYRF